MGAIEMSSQEHNGDFLQNDYDDSDWISVVYRENLHK
jgi:hypothetical protein